MKRKRVLVIGGGVSGLAAAVFLEAGGADVAVLEAGAEAGGHVRSESIDGRILDQAANGWLDNEPAMGRLLALLGDRLTVVPASGAYDTRWICADGALHPVPLSPPAMLKSRLLSLGQKLRLLGDLFVGRSVDPDESLGSFVRRRLGPAAVDRLVGPMVAGIFAADPDSLSLRAAFPRMAELEAEHRSLFLAMARLRKGGAPAGRLQTTQAGAGGLTTAMIEQLGSRVTCLTPAVSLSTDGVTWQVETPSGALQADAVVLAAPGAVQARLLEDLDPAGALAQAGIAYAPAAVVVMALPRTAFPREPRGFGVLMARGEAERLGVTGVLGTVFSHDVFPHQARPDELLLRTIVGGAIAPDAARLPDDALLTRVTAGLGQMFGPLGAQPHLTRIYRYAAAIPQYTVGHLDRVATVSRVSERYKGLFFAGNHLRGVGVKDCVRQGEEAARAVLAG